MKRIHRNLLLTITMVLSMSLSAQKIYYVPSGEFILSFVDATAISPGNGENSLNSIPRFTMWFHAGQYLNFDLNDNIGFYSGIAIRNMGFIIDENDIKTKYRSYNLGIPLAFKLGSFKKNTYVFGGAEYELLFHYKQKTFTNDDKKKFSEWFSNRTQRFLPSVFAGMQFPGGFHLKFQYYLNDFLNHNYKKEYSDGTIVDFTALKKTQVFFLSLGMWIPYNDRAKPKNIGTVARL